MAERSEVGRDAGGGAVVDGGTACEEAAGVEHLSCLGRREVGGEEDAEEDEDAEEAEPKRRRMSGRIPHGLHAGAGHVTCSDLI